jgi:hypothetical protein
MRNPPPRAVLATSRAKKLAVEFFETNAPNPPDLTENSCLVRFRTFDFARQNLCETRTQEPFWPLLEQKNMLLNFSKRPHPIHPRLTQNSSVVRFRTFGFGRQNSCETRR